MLPVPAHVTNTLVIEGLKMSTLAVRSSSPPVLPSLTRSSNGITIGLMPIAGSTKLTPIERDAVKSFEGLCGAASSGSTVADTSVETTATSPAGTSPVATTPEDTSS